MKMSKEEYELLQRLILDRGMKAVNKIGKEFLSPLLEERTLNFFKSISLIKVSGYGRWNSTFANVELAYYIENSDQKYYVFEFIEASNLKQIKTANVKFSVIDTETFQKFDCNFRYSILDETIVLGWLYKQKSFDKEIESFFNTLGIYFVRSNDEKQKRTK